MCTVLLWLYHKISDWPYFLLNICIFSVHPKSQYVWSDQNYVFQPNMFHVFFVLIIQNCCSINNQCPATFINYASYRDKGRLYWKQTMYLNVFKLKHKNQLNLLDSTCTWLVALKPTNDSITHILIQTWPWIYIT